jgi:hypothetical protein
VERPDFFFLSFFDFLVEKEPHSSSGSALIVEDATAFGSSF